MSKKVNSFKELEEYLKTVFGRQMAEDLKKGIQDELLSQAKIIVKEVKADHPWEDKSGSLTRSQKAERVGKINAKLLTRDKKARWLYRGTKRHRVPLFGDRDRMIWVSGVWAGKARTGRASGTRSTPKNAKELYWFLKRYKKRKNKILKGVNKAILKQFGLKLK